MKPGPYRHYKGKEYTVLGVARHSETEEELVVYRQEYGDHGLWVRPKDLFLETVEVEVVMTDIFVTGPLTAVIGFVGTLIYRLATSK